MHSSEQPRRRVRSAEEMFPLIQEWERSSLSKKEFYIRHGIKPHVFWYWLRRYREEGEPAPAPKAGRGFVSIEMEEEALGEEALVEVIYSDGTRLVFKERVSAAFLQGLLPKV